MKRLFHAAVAVILVISILAGCSAVTPAQTTAPAQTQPAATPEQTQSATAQPTPTSSDKVTLMLFHGKQEAQETFSAIIQAFETKYPNITIEQEIVTNDPATVLKARIATDETPDIFSAGTEVLDIAKGGYMVDLSSEAFLQNINEQTLKSSSFTDKDGKTWALPLDGSCIGIIYNKKIFSDNGLTAPQTITELNNVLATLKAKNITAFALGFKDAWTIKMAILSALSPAVYGFDLKWDSEKDAGTASFAATPGWTTAYNMLKLIYENGNTKTAFDTDYNGACSMFAQGKAAMMTQGLWAIEPIRAITPDLDIGIMGFPVSENPADAKLHQFPDFSLSISSSSKHIAEAKEFLSFLTTKDMAELWCNKAKLFSAVKGVEPNFDPVVADVNKLIADGKICTQADRGWPTPFSADFEKTLPDFLLGKLDLKTALSSLDTAWVKDRAVSSGQ